MTEIKSASSTTSIQSATATKAVQHVPRQDKLKDLIGSASVKEMFRNAMAEHADSFLASVVDLYNNDRTLQTCAPNEVLMEAFKAATLKLPINKQLGFAYIVPFNDRKLGKTVPTFQLGYKGLIQMAMRTGAYRHINGGPVFEGELVKENKLTGEIDLSGTKLSEKVLGYFAYIETLNGFSKTIYWDINKVTNHAKKYSKAFNFGPWQSDFDAMATKTLMRSLIGHYGIMSVEMQDAYAKDGTSLADQQIVEGKGITPDFKVDDIKEAGADDDALTGFQDDYQTDELPEALK